MTTKPLRVLGYVRRSTDKQAMSPKTQARRLRDAADIFDWDLTIREEQAASGKSLDGRPVLAEAMDDCDRGQADALAVAALDRLARSTRDFADILDRSERQSWSVICLDLGVDTSHRQRAARCRHPGCGRPVGAPHHREPHQGGHGDHPGDDRQAHGPSLRDPGRHRGPHRRSARRRPLCVSDRSADGGRGSRPAHCSVEGMAPQPRPRCRPEGRGPAGCRGLVRQGNGLLAADALARP